MASKIFHVIPDSTNSGWAVKVRGAKRFLDTFGLKKDALIFARDEARAFRERRSTNRASVTVHDRFGRFATSR